METLNIFSKTYRLVISALYPKFSKQKMVLLFDYPALFRMTTHFYHVLYALLLILYMRKLPTIQGKQLFYHA